MKKPTKKARISIIIALSLALVLILVLTLRSCSHDHAFGSEWVSDEVNHWHVCQDSSCDEVADLAAHTGGTATETQRAVCEVCGHEYGKLAAHEHQFGEWKTKTAATCEAAKVEYRVCTCGEEETRTIGEKLKHSYTAVVTLPTCTEVGYTTYTCSCGDSYTADTVEALGHQMETQSNNLYHWSACTNEGCAEMTEQEAHIPVSISVKKLDFAQTPMVGDVVKASDLHVYASCDCGTVYRVEKDLEIENAILKLGKNTVTVKLGKLSTTVDIDAVESYVALNSTVLGDTYVSSASAAAKDTGYADRETMGTYSNSFKVYLRFNFSEILASKDFAAYQYGAKVQFRFAVAEGEISDATTFTLKAFDPSTASFGVDFAKITFNSVKSGAHTDIHWDNGTALIDKQTLGEVVSYADGVITITVNYSAVEPYIDPTTGNALFGFATNTSGLKIASMENTEISGPKATVVYSTNAVAHEKHTYGSWETKSAATCEDAEIEQRVCSCGAVETRTGDPALGHSLALKYNDTYHWSACQREGCEYKTDHVAHSGGEATETERAVCDGCGQSYGELKGEEKVLTDISGIITDDTYISSASSTAKDSSYADRDTMGTYSESFKVYLRFNFSEILAREDFAACKDGAKIRFGFAVAEGEVTDTTTFTLKIYEAATASFGVDFSEITFNSVKTGEYTDIHWNSGTELVAKQTLGDMVSYADGIITITLNYSAVEPYIDPTTGNALFAFATNTKGVKIASMENAQLAHPAVTVTYNSGHVHAFTEEIATGVYLVSDECGKKAVYYKSCLCGAKGTETFEYGEVNAHRYIAAVTAPTCTEAGYTTYTCSCGDSYIEAGAAALGHNMEAQFDNDNHWTGCTNEGCNEASVKEPHTAISIRVEKTNYTTAPVAGETVTVGDLEVCATCDCGAVYPVTEGIELENETLSAGSNTITVRFGMLSTTVDIEAVDFRVVVNGSVVDDTYVSSANATAKDTNFADKETMGTNSNSFKVYLRFNFSDILGSEVYADYKNSASVQFTFAVAEGEISDTTTFTLKAYETTTASFGADFSKLTFNSVKSGAYADIHWDNGIVLIEKQPLGDAVSYDNGIITITLDYRDLEQYVDPATGNALFAFATNTSGLKIASMENTEFDHPAVTVTFSNRHVHTYTEEVAREEYLVSANCGEKAVYYKSCLCGEAGTETFLYGDVIPHTYGDWETKTPATCTEDEVEYRVCSCGAEETRTGDAALDHHMVSIYDKSYHWAECDRENCDYVTEREAHYGGTATDTEKAVCENCGQPYGGLAHEHSYTSVVTAPTCTAVGYTTYSCDCGSVYTADEVAALDHNMVTKYDEVSHWTECDREDCGYATEQKAHHGGTATETEQAVCEVCNQPYGELKEPVTLPITIAGTIVDDTYVSSDKMDTSYADRDTMGTYSSTFKVYLRFNFSDILASEVYADYKNSASVQFTFAVAEGTISDTTTFTLKAFSPEATSFGVGFSEITFNNVKNGEHKNIHWDNGTALVNAQTQGEVVSYADGIITITLDYRDIEQYIDPVSGNALFAFATSTTKGVKIASMENAEFDHPAVTVTFSDRHLHTFTEEVADEEYLVSANCGEKAVYYKSCACGEAGTETFLYGDVIPHTYGEWETKNPATCTEDEVEFRVCSCGAEKTRTGDVALGHTLTQVEAQGATCTEIGWNAYEHCSKCDYTTYEEIAALGHTYGDLIPAQTEIHTQTELKASVSAHYFCDVCDTYFTEEKAETTLEALTGAVPAHSYGSWIKTDSEKHWKECSCGLKSEEGSHVYTDDADTACDTCGYIRVIESSGPVTVAGTIVDDTYVSSENDTAKETNYAGKETMGTNSNSFKVYLRFNFSDVLGSEEFEAHKDSAKVQFAFAVSGEGELSDATTFTLKAYKTTTASFGVNFSEITFNSVKGEPHSDIHWGKGTALVDAQTRDEVVSYDNGIITITLDYSAIEDYVDPATGNALFAFATNTKGLKIASMENDAIVAPAVKVTFGE